MSFELILNLFSNFLKDLHFSDKFLVNFIWGILIRNAKLTLTKQKFIYYPYNLQNFARLNLLFVPFSTQLRLWVSLIICLIIYQTSLIYIQNWLSWVGQHFQSIRVGQIKLTKSAKKTSHLALLLLVILSINIDKCNFHH